MGRIRKKIDVNAKKGIDVGRVMEAAGLLKDSIVDEQAKKIESLEKLKEEYKNLAAHFKGVCAERDNLATCLEACEKDLKQKQDEAITMRREAVFQFKRAEKAEAFIKKMDEACDLIKKHIAAYGSKKKYK